MRTFLYSKYCCVFLCCCLASLLAACDFMPSSNTPSHAAITPSSISTQPTPTTVPVPPTQTSCPATGTARALVTASLVAGNHPSIVYTVTENVANSHVVARSILKRYDVKTGSTAVIATIPDRRITGASVSPDGQWVLFSSWSNPIDAGTAAQHGDYLLQVVRLDGQGLQTLYCGTYSNGQGDNQSSFQWAPDQKFIAFNNDTWNANTNDPNGTSTFSVQTLNLATGTLQTVFSYQTPYATIIMFRLWADATHMYLETSGPDGYTADLYLLDINKGANQRQSDLTSIVKGGYRSFQDSFDRSHLYVNYNGCDQVSCKPPSSIVAFPVLGGTQQTLWQSAQYNVIGFCSVNDHQLIVSIYNYQYSGSLDTSHNGLWVVNTDSPQMTRLTTTSPQTSSPFTPCTNSWDTASRDGSMYVVSISNNQEHSVDLEFGKLDGSSTPMIFAPGGNNLTVDMIGWTIM